MSRHVVMLLSNDAVSDPRVEKEAQALAQDDWRVTVLAWDRSGQAPAREDRSGYTIERHGPPSMHGGGVRNIPAYRRFWAAVAARAVELKPDVIHCHDLDTAPAGQSAHRSCRKAGLSTKLVLDFHELYRESKMVPQKGAVGIAARAAVRVVEKRAIPAADVILVANPGTLGYYDRFRPRRVVTIENAPDLERFSPSAPREAGTPLKACFIGQKRYTQGLYTLMEAVQRHDDITALLAGGGVAEAEIAEAAKRYERVETMGRIAYADIPALYRDCDVVYAVYDQGLGNVQTLFPVKAMEGMACAVPVIVSTGTWIAEYVEAHGLGFAVDAGDVDSVEAALVALRDNPALAAEMGQRGRAIIESELNWQAVAERLRATYRELASA